MGPTGYAIMTFLVTSIPAIANKFVVKQYQGYGIKGSDIPVAGTNGGSPVINDSPNAGDEYYWRIATPASVGVLEIYPDLTFKWDMAGVAAGTYTFSYSLYENKILQTPNATVTVVVGNASQILRPLSDASNGPWLQSTGGSLFSCIDEASRNTDDFVYTNNAGACRFKLTAGQMPATSNNHTLTYCISGLAGRLVVTLQQGTSDIANWTHSTLPLNPTDYSRSLTSPQIAAISDYTNLYLKFESFVE